MMRTRHFGTSEMADALWLELWRAVPWTGLGAVVQISMAYTLWALFFFGGGGCPAAAAGHPLGAAPSQQRTESARLGFDEVVRQLSIAAGVPPVSLGVRRARLRSRPSEYPEDRYQISVAEQGERLMIQLGAGGGYGFTVLREFFECPLFTRAESEALHGLLSAAGDGPSRRVGRFRASVRLETTADELWLTLWLEPFPQRHKRSSCRGPTGVEGSVRPGKLWGATLADSRVRNWAL